MSQPLAPPRHAPPAARRRPPLTAELSARAGRDEAPPPEVVRAFCGRVRRDPSLEPIFAARIEDRGPHPERMTALWPSAALTTGRRHGSPMRAHLPLPVEGAHFDRWLTLFRKTAFRETERERCSPEGAAHPIERAERVAASIGGAMRDARGGNGMGAAPPALRGPARRERAR